MAAPPSDSLGSAVEHHLRSYFAAHEDGLPASGLYDRILREVERPLIELSLAATNGNQIRAAKLLGVNRNTLRKKIRDPDIQVIRGLKYAVANLQRTEEGKAPADTDAPRRAARTGERRVGQEGVSTWRYRGGRVEAQKDKIEE